jgi:transcriptional regulator with PAS, ATPase and Fis domain
MADESNESSGRTECRALPVIAAESDLLCRAFECLPEPVLVLNTTGDVLHANRRAEQLLCMAREEIVGKSCAELLSSGVQDGRCPCGERMLSLGDDASQTVRCGDVLATLSLLRDAHGKPAGVVACLRPSTARAELPHHAEEFSLRDLVGRSAAVRRIADTVRRLANSDVAVLITGESGTGKELVARALHGTSRRKDKPFVAINCGAIPTELAESELFGHVRGAFTGALRDRKGAVEAAEGGTFLLDEVGDLAPSVQPKLLRLLQDRTYQSVGDPKTRAADIRVVAATNVDLDRAVEEGRFRRDLLYRLRVVPILLPALRERVEDIAPLASILLTRRAVVAGRMPMRLSPPAMQLFERHPWPGNVRELINVLDYLVALCPTDTVEPDDLPADFGSGQESTSQARGRYVAASDSAQEAGRIQQALERNDFHRQRTAAALGMDRVTLYRKMKEHGIEMQRSRVR